LIEAFLLNIEDSIIRYKSFFKDHLGNIGSMNLFMLIRKIAKSELTEKIDHRDIIPKKGIFSILMAINCIKDFGKYLNKTTFVTENFIACYLIADKEYFSGGITPKKVLFPILLRINWIKNIEEYLNRINYLGKNYFYSDLTDATIAYKTVRNMFCCFEPK